MNIGQYFIDSQRAQRTMVAQTRMRWHIKRPNGTWDTFIGSKNYATLEECISDHSYTMKNSPGTEIIVISETEYIHTWFAHWGMNVDHFKMLPVEE